MGTHRHVPFGTAAGWARTGARGQRVGVGWPEERGQGGWCGFACEAWGEGLGVGGGWMSLGEGAGVGGEL